MAAQTKPENQRAYTESMVPNAVFWASYCLLVYVRALKGFRVGALEKVTPAFEGIAEDADRATEAEYERLGSMPYDGQTDMSDVAEMAHDHGIADYETMFGVRQGVLNVLAVGLYHLFEQQQLFFLRRELLSRAEETVPALLKEAEFKKRLAECGVECRSFSCADKLHELRTAANAIKHGTGPAGDELAKLRPGLHVEPVRAVDALVLVLVAGVGAGQAAQHHHPCHEAEIGVRFAGSDKLVHLIGNGEASPRLLCMALFSHDGRTRPTGDGF